MQLSVASMFCFNFQIIKNVISNIQNRIQWRNYRVFVFKASIVAKFDFFLFKFHIILKLSIKYLQLEAAVWYALDIALILLQKEFKDKLKSFFQATNHLRSLWTHESLCILRDINLANIRSLGQNFNVESNPANKDKFSVCSSYTIRITE